MTYRIGMTNAFAWAWLVAWAGLAAFAIAGFWLEWSSAEAALGTVVVAIALALLEWSVIAYLRVKIEITDDWLRVTPEPKTGPVRLSSIGHVYAIRSPMDFRSSFTMPGSFPATATLKLMRRGDHSVRLPYVIGDYKRIERLVADLESAGEAAREREARTD